MLLAMRPDPALPALRQNIGQSLREQRVAIVGGRTKEPASGMGNELLPRRPAAEFLVLPHFGFRKEELVVPWPRPTHDERRSVECLGAAEELGHVAVEWNVA